MKAELLIPITEVARIIMPAAPRPAWIVSPIVFKNTAAPQKTRLLRQSWSLCRVENLLCRRKSIPFAFPRVGYVDAAGCSNVELAPDSNPALEIPSNVLQTEAAAV